MPNKVIHRILHKLPARCTQQSTQLVSARRSEEAEDEVRCSFAGTYEAVRNHIKQECPFTPCRCSREACQAIFSRAEAQAHEASCRFGPRGADATAREMLDILHPHAHRRKLLLGLLEQFWDCARMSWMQPVAVYSYCDAADLFLTAAEAMTVLGLVCRASKAFFGSETAEVVKDLCKAYYFALRWCVVDAWNCADAWNCVLVGWSLDAHVELRRQPSLAAHADLSRHPAFPPSCKRTPLSAKAFEKLRVEGVGAAVREAHERSRRHLRPSDVLWEIFAFEAGNAQHASIRVMSLTTLLCRLRDRNVDWDEEKDDSRITLIGNAVHFLNMRRGEEDSPYLPENIIKGWGFWRDTVDEALSMFCRGETTTQRG